MSENWPTSPHVQIYRLPITGWVSILHRISGFILFAVLGGVFPVWLLVLAYCPDWLTGWYAHASDWWFVTLQVLVSLTLVYHALSGVRHLAMDCGYLLGKNSSRLGAWLLLISTGLLTGFLWLM